MALKDAHNFFIEPNVRSYGFVRADAPWSNQDGERGEEQQQYQRSLPATVASDSFAKEMG